MQLLLRRKILPILQPLHQHHSAHPTLTQLLHLLKLFLIIAKRLPHLLLHCFLIPQPIF